MFCFLKSYLCKMKIILSILSALLVSCTSPKSEIPTEILSEMEFGNMLKEIHLEEAAFELKKNKGGVNAKNSLANNYKSIYKKYDVDASAFSKSLNYYAEKPKILEEIYSIVLNQLVNERSTLDQQETN